MARKRKLNNYRNCPTCEKENRKIIFLTKNIDNEKITSFSFASRKEPEFMRFQLMRCLECDLVYADEPPTEDNLHNSYHDADYDSDTEAIDAAKTYIHSIKNTLDVIPKKRKALDIGTGNGIFLEHLIEAGFEEVIGIEPSPAAIKKAKTGIKERIKVGIFNESDFESNSFDLICCFMTMEHVLDPKMISDSIFRLLKPGGAFVTITHNYRSIVNRLMGEKSPIIDIEHMQIFSHKSIVNLMSKSNFENISNKSIKNSYRISYWIKLLPFNKQVKSILNKFIRILGLHKFRLKINVGNQITSGFKL